MTVTAIINAPISMPTRRAGVGKEAGGEEEQGMLGSVSIMSVKHISGLSTADIARQQATAIPKNMAISIAANPTASEIRRHEPAPACHAQGSPFPHGWFAEGGWAEPRMWMASGSNG